MNAARFMLLSAFAEVTGSVSRFGPTVPVAPAGWKVWHVAQPFAAKTAFPAATFPPAAAVVVPADVVVAAEVVVAADVVVAGADVPPMVTVFVEDDAV